MEKKTKQRILGLFFIVGLTVVLLPLFHNRTSRTDEKILIQAPPFPDQATSLKPMATEPEISSNEEKPSTSANTTPAQKAVAPANESMKQEKTIAPTSNTVQEDKTTLIDITPASEPEKKTENLSFSSKKSVIQTSTSSAKSHVVAKQYRKPIEQSVEKNWVVQMGSFRNKANALRLVEQLRAQGYKAYSQPSPSGANMQVYVGPENKFGAKKLRQRLEAEVHMQGIVVRLS